MIWLLFDIPKVMPLLLTNATVPVVAAVWVPAARMLYPSAPPPPAAADKLSVKPALLLAVVPLRLVRFSCGLPWLWLDCAAVVSHAGWFSYRLSPAVLCVMDPLIRLPAKPDVVPAALLALRLMPAEFTVQASGPAVRAVARPTASLLARAVVRPL